MTMIPIAKPLLGAEEISAIKDVLESGMVVQGARVAAFEEEFAKYLGVRHAVAVNSGTAALHVALLAHGVRKGREVLIPPLTFFATASTVLMCGAAPAFADVHRDTYTMDPAAMKKAVGMKTSIIMPVHLYGQTADMSPILEVAGKKDLIVIEDAAQAHGAKYDGKMAGAIGDAACFSFYATKTMTTAEGGMVVTNEDEIAEKCRLLRDHGQTSKYEHVIVGYNYRMTDVTAAIGSVQLRKLDEWVRRRRENAQALTRAIEGISGLIPPVEGEHMFHSYYQYIVRVEPSFPLKRDEIVKTLNERGIGCRPSYPKTLYEQKALKDLKIGGKCPVAEEVVGRLFELPVHPAVSASDITQIATEIERLRDRR